MSAEVGSRVFWSDGETKLLLSVIKKKQILKLIDQKIYRREEALKLVENVFYNCGITSKTIPQINNKWKNLKKLYMKAKKTNTEDTCPYYAQLEEILTPTALSDEQASIRPKTPEPIESKMMKPIKCAEIFYVDGNLKYNCFFCANNNFEDINTFELHLYSIHLKSLQLEDELNFSYQEIDEKPTIPDYVETVYVNVLDELKIEPTDVDDKENDTEMAELDDKDNDLEFETGKEYDAAPNEIIYLENESETSTGIIEMSSGLVDVCDYCNMEFHLKNQLKKHMWKFKNLKFKCSECEKKVCGIQRFNQHMKLHTEQKQRIANTGGNRISELRRKHIRKRSNTVHTCEICKKVFRELWNLKTHMRLHTGEKPYVCNQCNQRFNESTSLKMHIRHHHTNERPYLCTECGATYGFLRILNAHIRRTHIKFSNGPQPCSVCSKLFDNSERLRNHMKIHEKPHPCIHCDKSFAERKVLNLHIQKWHS